MEAEQILHDVIVLLNRMKCNDRNLQEDLIKMFMSDDVETIDEILRQHGRDYTCDFNELLRDVQKSLDAELFYIK